MRDKSPKKATPERKIASDVLLEAEGFEEHGGWVIDPQFMDVMGSSYLMAHGLSGFVRRIGCHPIIRVDSEC